MNKKIISSLSVIMIVSVLYVAYVRVENGDIELQTIKKQESTTPSASTTESPGMFTRITSWIGMVYRPIVTYGYMVYQPTVTYGKTLVGYLTLKLYQRRLDAIKFQIASNKEPKYELSFSAAIELIKKNIDNDMQELETLEKKIHNAYFQESQKPVAELLIREIVSLKKQLIEQRQDEAGSEKKENFYENKRANFHTIFTTPLNIMYRKIRGGNAEYSGNFNVLATLKTIKNGMDIYFDSFTQDDMNEKNHLWINDQKTLFLNVVQEYARSTLNNQQGYFMDLVKRINSPQEETFIKESLKSQAVSFIYDLNNLANDDSVVIGITQKMQAALEGQSQTKEKQKQPEKHLKKKVLQSLE